MAADRDESPTTAVDPDGPIRSVLRRADRALVVTFAVAALASIVFAKLFDAVRENDRMVRIDEAATRWIAQRRGDPLNDAMQVVTRLADPWLVAAVVIFTAAALIARRQHGAALFVAASSVGTALLVRIVKAAIGRPRPDGAVITVTGSSFPSGHAAQSIALYGAVALLVANVVQTRSRRLAVLATAALVVLSVGISRVVLGVHWLSDVIAGWVLAAGWLAMLLAGRRAREITPGGAHD